MNEGLIFLGRDVHGLIKVYRSTYTAAGNTTGAGPIVCLPHHLFAAKGFADKHALGFA
jgi:hypothetical protein